MSDLNEWIWNWQENTNICHIYLVHSCFKRTQVALKFCIKSQRFSAGSYFKVSLNLLHVLLSHSKNKAKILFLITSYCNVRSWRISSDKIMYRMYFFKLLFKYSCLHFPPDTSHPQLPPLILPPFSFVHMPFIHVPWQTFPLSPPVCPPTSPLVIVSS